MNDDNIPEVRGELVGPETDYGSWSVRVRCPYCDDDHLHGAGASVEESLRVGAGYRRSHCTSVDGGQYKIVLECTVS